MDKQIKEKIKKILKKIWWFIWESDSIWSWMVNIILAFILIKFIVYPGLGFALSTSHPIVAVVSGSMEHDGDFDRWWDSSAVCSVDDCTQGIFYNEIGISKQEFLEFKYEDGFNMGDIMILKGTKPEKIKLGDVLVFRSIRPDPIIHRVIKIQQEDGVYYFQTKGDHNSNSYESLGEHKIPQDKVIGKAVVRVPYLGWIKLVAVKAWTVMRPR